MNSEKPIKIAVLYSKTGTLAISERPLIQVIEMAIEELNVQGGLLNRKIEIVYIDGKSDSDFIADEIDRLSKAGGISAFFACWSSACRKRIKPIIEMHNQLLFYITQYEGLESSPNIIYLGSTPNQQIIPGTKYMLDHFGKKTLLVGSDYVFPRLANIIVKDTIKAFKGTIIDELYLPLGSRDFANIIRKIKKTNPDFIVNTINGDSNKIFLEQLIKNKLNHVPVFSTSLSETEFHALGLNTYISSHYAVWNYFQSLNTSLNQKFVENFKKKFGSESVISSPMVSAYTGISIWAEAVRNSYSDNPEMVNRIIVNDSGVGPGGRHAVSKNRHLWQNILIGHLQSDGQFKVVFSSDGLIHPDPFPFFRNMDEWNEIVRNFMEGKK